MSERILLWIAIAGFAVALVAVGVAFAVSNHPDRAKASKLFFFLAALVLAVEVFYWTISTSYGLPLRLGINLLAFGLIAVGLIAGFRFANRSLLAELQLPSSTFVPDRLWPQNKRLVALVVIGILAITTALNLARESNLGVVLVKWVGAHVIPWSASAFWLMVGAALSALTVFMFMKRRQRSCSEPRLHDLAKQDAIRIKGLVRIPYISYQPNFDKDGPYLDFVFTVFNNSLYDIVIDNSIKKGDLWCEPDNKELDYAPKIKDKQPIPCGSRSGNRFTVRQSLRLEEISRFKGKDHVIGFGGLVITFTGTEQFPEILPTQLKTNYYLETKKGAWPNPNRTDEFAFLYTDEQWALLSSSNKREGVTLKAKIDSLKSQLEETKKPYAIAKAGDKPKDEPQITGIMNEVYFHPCEDMHTCIVAMNIHIENDGRPTKIQEFELQFLFHHNPVHNDPVSCVPFQVRRPARSGNDSEVVRDLLDLRDLNKTPFERHFPRDGWLCFEISSGGVYPLDLDNDYARRLVRLQLMVKDGVNARHAIVQVYPFPENGKLEKRN